MTFNHFTSPHWFAKRGGWLDPEAPALFARYCDKVMERFGDRIAYAVTLNEPNLPHVLTWLNLPDFVRQVERATLDAASEKAGVPAYRLGNVVLPEELDAMEDGMTAGHSPGKAAIKARRPDLPVGLSLAIMDDVVGRRRRSVRDRKRAECYEHWLELARDDDFIGVQNYERVPYDAHGQVAPPRASPVNEMGTAIEPLSLAGAVRYAYEVTGVPILVTEHGIGTADDRLRAAFIEPSLVGLLDAMADGVPVLGYCHWTLMDNFEWIFGYAHQLGLHEVDRETFERTPKPSAGVYADLVKRYRGLAPSVDRHDPADQVCGDVEQADRGADRELDRERHVIRPLVGSIKRSAIAATVDLPEPLTPTIATRSSSPTWSSTPCSTHGAFSE